MIVVCGVVQALKDEDNDTLQSTLHAARACIVHELTSISTESAASINPAVVRLQMLHSFVEASELCGSAASQQTGSGHHSFPTLESVSSLWDQKTLLATPARTRKYDFNAWLYGCRTQQTDNCLCAWREMGQEMHVCYGYILSCPL